MTDQPTDRGEELRGLSDYHLGRLRESLQESAFRAGWSFAHRERKEIAAIEAEWDRRCAEREAEKAELERLRVLRHELSLIEADTRRGITDCSTPLFQRVRNIVAQAEATEAELEQLREALLPFVLYFEHAFDQAKRPQLAFPDPVADGLAVTQAEVTRARDLLSPQPRP